MYFVPEANAEWSPEHFQPRAPHHLSQTGVIMNTFRKMISLAAMASMLALSVLFAAPSYANSTSAQLSAATPLTQVTSVSAEAQPTCYGDYCSGQDPVASGCAEGAVTLDSHVQELGGGIVELRYSPKCGTNWAKWTQYPTGWCLNCGIVDLRAVQDTGYTQAIDLTNKTINDGESVWTPMIYSPVKKVKAEILGICGDNGIVASAFDCATKLESTRSL